MPISAIDAISPAFQHTKQQLLHPFRAAQWAKLALVGFLAGELSSGGCNGGSFRLPARPSGGHRFMDFGLPNVNPVLFASLIALLIVLVSGFGAIIYAALLTRRVAHHQKAWLHTKRLPPTHWRDVWAECLIGVGASFVALALVIAGSSATRFVGSGFFALMIGMAWRSGRHLNATAKRRHGAALAASLPPPPPI